MAQIGITATKRTATGKQAARLRKAGKLPGVLYGHNVDNQQLEVDERDFAKAFKQAGESTIIDVTIDGKAIPALIHEVQHHYLTDEPIHVDFYAINMTEKLKVGVPLRFVGESSAVKALGGTLVKNLGEVEVECLPADLPHAIEVDITSLNNFEDAIRVSDLKIPDRVEVITNSEEVVAAVEAPRTEEEMAALNEEVKEDVSAVEGVVKPEAPAEGEAAPAVKEEKE